MAELKSQVAAKILEVLPDVAEKANEAANHLVDQLELESLSELGLTAEADLTPFFGTFKARRLINTWKQAAGKKVVSCFRYSRYTYSRAL